MSEEKKDITSADGEEVSKKSNKQSDIRQRENLTADNRTRENFEQAILSQNVSTAARVFDSNPELFNYQTFRQVMGNGAKLVNKLRGIDDIGAFYGIKNSVLSLMQPKIRIYKVVHNEIAYDETALVDSVNTLPLSYPVYKEFKFADNFGQENVGSVQDYLAYESTRPSFRNVGLESFSIEHIGKDYGVLDNNLKCSLRVSFKSLKDLGAQPPGEPSPDQGGLRYIDLVLYPPSKYDVSSEELNNKHFEIRALVGYTLPSREQLEALNLSKKELDQLRSIEMLNTVYTLRLHNYSLDIGDAGEVNLTCNYLGGLETIIGANQVNIFQDMRRVGKMGRKFISQNVDPKFNPAKLFSIETKVNNLELALKRISCRDDSCTARSLLKKLLLNDQLFAELYLEAGGKGLIARNGRYILENGGETAVLWFKRKSSPSKILALIRRRANSFKKDVYKTFVDQLITGNEERGSLNPETRLFCANIPAEEVSSYMGVIEKKEATNKAGEAQNDDAKELAELSGVSEELAREALRGGTTAVGKGTPTLALERCNKVVEEDAAMKEEIAQELLSIPDGQSKSTDKKTGEKKKDPARKSVFRHDGKGYSFYYVYFGDIVELACKNAGVKAIDLKNVDDLGREATEQEHPVFSPSTYYGYKTSSGQLAKQGGDEYGLSMARILLGPIEYLDAQTGELAEVNLAKYPISFNYFRSFFFNEVINKEKKFMPLGTFLSLLVNKLLIPSMGIGMPSSIKPRRTVSTIASLTLPGKQLEGKKMKVGNQNVPKIEELLPKHRQINVDGPIFKSLYSDRLSGDISTESMVKTSFDYIVMYGTTAKHLIEREGNPIKDLKDGIYHFSIGSDKGLLNKMSFERVNIPYLKELRFLESLDDGKDSLEQLRQPFNTTVDLIGTSLFTPGMFFYANPSLTGLGEFEDARSISYQLNLGGYHYIQSVKSVITPGSYQTTLVGVQVQQGRPR